MKLTITLFYAHFEEAAMSPVATRKLVLPTTSVTFKWILFYLSLQMRTQTWPAPSLQPCKGPG